MSPTLEETKDGRDGGCLHGDMNESVSSASLCRMNAHAQVARESNLNNSSRRRTSFSSYSPTLPGGGASVVSQVTVDTDARERILQGQRDATLRRRKQHFQSGFIGAVNNPHVVNGPGRRTSMPDPRLGLGPSIQNFSRSVDVRSTSSIGGFGHEVPRPLSVSLTDPQIANGYPGTNHYHNHVAPRDGFHINHSASNERTIYDYDDISPRFNGMALNNGIDPVMAKHNMRHPTSLPIGSQHGEIVQMDFDQNGNSTSNNMEQSTYRHALTPVNSFRSFEGAYEDHDDAMSDLTEQRTYDGQSRIGIHNPSINNRMSGKIVRSPSRLSNMVKNADRISEEEEIVSQKSKLSVTNETPSLGNTSTTDSSKDADTNDHGVESAGIAKNLDDEDAKASAMKKFLETIDWDNMKEVKKFLMEPVPKSVGILQCYMKRNKGKSKLHPEYRVYLRENDRFLMSSKKRARKQVSNYLISMGRNDHHRGSDNIIGKLKANFVGTEFQIFDGGKNPREYDPFFDEKNEDTVRSELGAILYSSNKWGSKGPRKMQVCINRVKEGGGYTKMWQPVHKDEEMLQCFKYKSDSALRHLLFFENRQPKWNEEMGAYVLNFNNRVKLASVKNFQLVEKDPDDGEIDKVTMQFGRNGKDEFVVDAQWPMSLFQAFAIALSSCDSKIACD